MTNEKTTDSAASALSAGLERMFSVAKTDHPDLVGGIVWTACELRWINERITLAILAEREACAIVCDEEAEAWRGPKYSYATAVGEHCAKNIRMRSNAKSEGAEPLLAKLPLD